MRLDAKTVAALDLGGKTDAIWWDDTVKGFGYRLRLGAGGRVLRSWVAQYRRAGATRRYLIGSAEVLPADAARTAAKKVLARVQLGEDPQGDRGVRRDKDKLNFRAIADEYIAFKQTGKKPLRARTLVETKRYLTSGYFKSLHAMPIDQIGRRDVASQLTTIIRESGSPTASRARSVLSAMFVWAMKSGIIEANPVINTPEPEDSEPRERVLSNDELAAILRACGDDEYGRIIKLLTLTGCRRTEIGGMRWSEFNADVTSWTLPATRSKNGRSHTLPLPPLAQEIIQSVPRMAFRDQLFGVRGDAGFKNWVRGKRALDAGCGVSDWVVHDIRRTVATRLADLGVQPHIVEQILNHQSGHKRGVAGTYNKSVYEREVRAAIALWADRVGSLVDGGEHRLIPFVPASAS